MKKNKLLLVPVSVLVVIVLVLIIGVFDPTSLLDDFFEKNPVKKLDQTVKDGIAEEISIERNEALTKMVKKNKDLDQSLYPADRIKKPYEEWRKLSSFINRDGITEKELYKNVNAEVDLLVLGWTHNFGNRSGIEAAETLEKYIDSGKEINYLIIEGFPRGHEAIAKFNEGEISPGRLSDMSKSKTPNSPWSPYGERGWNKALFQTLRKRNIELVGLEKRRDVDPLERAEAIPVWTKEIVKEKGQGAILVGKGHINPYLFTRATALWQIINYRENFLKGIEKLGKDAFIASLPFKMLVVDLYSQVDYTLNWDLISSILLYMVKEDERLDLFNQFKKDWHEEREKCEQERIYRAPQNTLEKVFPDHQEPVVTPSNPPYLNATSVYLSLYPPELTRNFIFQPNQQGDFFQYEIGSEKTKVMEMNSSGKVTKVILPK